MATRVNKNKNTATCIDHVITDAMFHADNVSFKFSLDDLFGDHKAILLNVSIPKIKILNKPQYFDVVKVNHAKIISQNYLARVRRISFSNFQSDLKTSYKKTQLGIGDAKNFTNLIWTLKP